MKSPATALMFESVSVEEELPLIENLHFYLQITNCCRPKTGSTKLSDFINGSERAAQIMDNFMLKYWAKVYFERSKNVCFLRVFHPSPVEKGWTILCHGAKIGRNLSLPSCENSVLLIYGLVNLKYRRDLKERHQPKTSLCNTDMKVDR